MNIEKKFNKYFLHPPKGPDSNPTRPELPDPSLQVGKCRSSIKTKWERHLRKDMVYHGPLETNSESRLVANSCMKVNKSHDVLVYQRGKESTTILSCTATEYSKKIEIFCFAKIYDEFRVSGFWGADYLMQSTNVVKILINILTQTYCTLFTFCSTMWSGCAICIYIWLKVRAAFHSFRSFCIIITLVCINSIKKFSVWYHANKSYFMKIWLQTP